MIIFPKLMNLWPFYTFKKLLCSDVWLGTIWTSCNLLPPPVARCLCLNYAGLRSCFCGCTLYFSTTFQHNYYNIIRIIITVKLLFWVVWLNMKLSQITLSSFFHIKINYLADRLENVLIPVCKWWIFIADHVSFPH